MTRSERAVLNRLQVDNNLTTLPSNNGNAMVVSTTQHVRSDLQTPPGGSSMESGTTDYMADSKPTLDKDLKKVLQTWPPPPDCTAYPKFTRKQCL